MNYPHELRRILEEKRNSKLSDGCQVLKVGGYLAVVSRETCGDCCLSRYLHERRARSRSTYVHHVVAHVDYRWHPIVASCCERYDLQTRAELENSRFVRWRPSCIIALPLRLCWWLKPSKLPTTRFASRNVKGCKRLFHIRVQEVYHRRGNHAYRAVKTFGMSKARAARYLKAN